MLQELREKETVFKSLCLIPSSDLVQVDRRKLIDSRIISSDNSPQVGLRPTHIRNKIIPIGRRELKSSIHEFEFDVRADVDRHLVFSNRRFDEQIEPFESLGFVVLSND